ncbi:unnamed protein product [Linum trigynum]
MFSPSWQQLEPEEEIDQPDQTLVEPAVQVGPTDPPPPLPKPTDNPQPPRSSLELLQKYGGGGGGGVSGNRPSSSSTCSTPPPQWRPLAVEEALRIAGRRIVEFSSGKAGAPSMLNIPFDPSLSHLCEDDVRSVELAEYLLAAAERIGDKQFDHAAALLNLCESLASNTGNAVQRLGYCFCKALRKKIAHDTGNKPPQETKTSVRNANESKVLTSDFIVKAMQCGAIPMFQFARLISDNHELRVEFY